MRASSFRLFGVGNYFPSGRFKKEGRFWPPSGPLFMLSLSCRRSNSRSGYWTTRRTAVLLTTACLGRGDHKRPDAASAQEKQEDNELRAGTVQNAPLDPAQTKRCSNQRSGASWTAHHRESWSLGRTLQDRPPPEDCGTVKIAKIVKIERQRSVGNARTRGHKDKDKDTLLRMRQGGKAELGKLILPSMYVYNLVSGRNRGWMMDAKYQRDSKHGIYYTILYSIRATFAIDSLAVPEPFLASSTLDYKQIVGGVT